MGLETGDRIEDLDVQWPAVLTSDLVTLGKVTADAEPA